ncbi:phage prohead protease [Caudoviricetes sp.]|nr:phage prohead protease [Caudoviricetes sp.]
MQAFLDSVVEIKSFNSATGEFEGYASTYGNVDHGNDVVCKGAFDEVLSGGALPAMCWQHDMKEVIGEWLEMKSDAKGLYVKGRIWINKGIARAEQAFEMLKGKGPKGLSIGFIAKAAQRAKNGVRMITKALLKEISVVTYPMNDQAQVLSVKSDGDWDELEEKYNPNHDERGRFSSGDLAGGVASGVNALVSSGVLLDRSPMSKSNTPLKARASVLDKHVSADSEDLHAARAVLDSIADDVARTLRSSESMYRPGTKEHATFVKPVQTLMDKIWKVQDTLPKQRKSDQNDPNLELKALIQRNIQLITEHKMNPNHDENGRFASGDGGGSAGKATASRDKAKKLSEAAGRAGTYEAHTAAKRAAFEAMADHEDANGGKESSYLRALYESHKEEAAALRSTKKSDEEDPNFEAKALIKRNINLLNNR